MKQAEDNAAAAGRTLTESQKYDLFREALLKLKEQFPALGGHIDAYVARLKTVPATVNTTVRVLGASDAELALLNVEKRIRGVTNIGGVTVRIPPVRKDPKGDGPGAGGPALARVRARCPPACASPAPTAPRRQRRGRWLTDELHMDRGNPAVDIAGPMSLLDAFYPKAGDGRLARAHLARPRPLRPHPRRSRGRPDLRPGTGTSDSIPAWLSHGEHVWTAREVERAGGHGVMERMRAVFRATGGPITRALAPVRTIRTEDGTKVAAGFYGPTLTSVTRGWSTLPRSAPRRRRGRTTPTLSSATRS